MAETYLVTEGVDGNTECSCQTEITNLEFSSPVDEQILGFEITVQYSVVVAECDTLWTISFCR
jgi:hypothetical protein